MRKKPDVSAAEHIENILILIERSESILNLQRPFGKVNLSERRQIQNQDPRIEINMIRGKMQFSSHIAEGNASETVFHGGAPDLRRLFFMEEFRKVRPDQQIAIQIKDGFKPGKKVRKKKTEVCRAFPVQPDRKTILKKIEELFHIKNQDADAFANLFQIMQNFLPRRGNTIRKNQKQIGIIGFCSVDDGADGDGDRQSKIIVTGQDDRYRSVFSRLI